MDAPGSALGSASSPCLECKAIYKQNEEIGKFWQKNCLANFVRWESAAFPIETLGGLDAGTKKFLNLTNMTLNVITMHRLCNCWLINVSWNHRITANFTELQHIVSKNRFSCENMQLWVSLQRAHSSCSLYRHCTIRAQDCTWARNNWTNWFRDTEQVRAALRGQSALHV